MSIAETVMTANGARALIDARLDAIDRALLGRVSRAERLDVVGEVESRIGELLYVRCGPSEPSREDVLAVLAQLDPPEAYLGDDDEDFERPRGFVGSARAMPRGLPDLESRARASGICGIVSAVAGLLLPICIAAAVTLSSATLFLGGIILFGLTAFTFGVIAAVLAITSRFRNGWAIAGISLGVAGCLAAMVGFLILAAEFFG